MIPWDRWGHHVRVLMRIQVSVRHVVRRKLLVGIAELLDVLILGRDWPVAHEPL